MAHPSSNISCVAATRSQHGVSIRPLGISNLHNRHLSRSMAFKGPKERVSQGYSYLIMESGTYTRRNPFCLANRYRCIYARERAKVQQQNHISFCHKVVKAPCQQANVFTHSTMIIPSRFLIPQMNRGRTIGATDVFVSTNHPRRPLAYRSSSGHLHFQETKPRAPPSLKTSQPLALST